jgi:hypothetical protein
VALRRTNMFREHNYKGKTIRPCEYPASYHRERWYVQAYHAPTGRPYADEVCPHFYTLTEAREAIDLQIAHEEVSR